MKSISEILHFLNLRNTSNKIHYIDSIFLDSRKCHIKSAFVALKGQSTDGNKYIEHILLGGVRLVLTDNPTLANNIDIFYVEKLRDKLSDLAKWFYDYSKPQNIIGITGTNGKTSISNYIAQFFSLAEQKSLLLGTNGNGIYPKLLESTHTTLDILSLYKTIKSCESYQNLVMEVSSHSLDQQRVKGIDFDIAVFSNLSQDHFDYHKTMENYFEAKAKLFRFKNLSSAVINIDDDYGKKLCDICNCKITTVSLKAKRADFYLEIKSIENTETSFDLYIYQEFIGTYQTLLIGKFNLMNLGLSLAALNNKVDRNLLLSKISQIKPVKGRMEIMELVNNIKVIIDYAHTPDALEKVLETLNDYPSNKLWCMFGCGGGRDTTKRSKMAAIVDKYADKIVVTEDNSRFEDINNIFNDIKKGFKNNQNHIYIPSREEAIRYCIENAKVGDVILLAGKGHECYLDKNGIKKYFDERGIITKYQLFSVS